MTRPRKANHYSHCSYTPNRGATARRRTPVEGTVYDNHFGFVNLIRSAPFGCGVAPLFRIGTRYASQCNAIQPMRDARRDTPQYCAASFPVRSTVLWRGEVHSWEQFRISGGSGQAGTSEQLFIRVAKIFLGSVSSSGRSGPMIRLPASRSVRNARSATRVFSSTASASRMPRPCTRSMARSLATECPSGTWQGSSSLGCWHGVRRPDQKTCAPARLLSQKHCERVGAEYGEEPTPCWRSKEPSARSLEHASLRGLWRGRPDCSRIRPQKPKAQVVHNGGGAAWQEDAGSSSRRDGQMRGSVCELPSPTHNASSRDRRGTVWGCHQENLNTQRGVWYGLPGPQRKGRKHLGADDRSLAALSARLVFISCASIDRMVSRHRGDGIASPVIRHRTVQVALGSVCLPASDWRRAGGLPLSCAFPVAIGHTVGREHASVHRHASAWCHHLLSDRSGALSPPVTGDCDAGGVRDRGFRKGADGGSPATSDESLAKATRGKAGTAGVTGPVRRSTAGTGLRVGEAVAVQPATSEIMDATGRRDAHLIRRAA